MPVQQFLTKFKLLIPEVHCREDDMLAYAAGVIWKGRWGCGVGKHYSLYYHLRFVVLS